MAKFYCEYCGEEFNSVQSLTNNTCKFHPDGFHKGKHKLYEGAEKAKYTCKYCGEQFISIRSLTNTTCKNHPGGFHKGKHAPAL